MWLRGLCLRGLCWEVYVREAWMKVCVWEIVFEDLLLKTKIAPKLRKLPSDTSTNSFVWVWGVWHLEGCGWYYRYSIGLCLRNLRLRGTRCTMCLAHMAENLLLAVDGSSKGDNVRWNTWSSWCSLFSVNLNKNFCLKVFLAKIWTTLLALARSCQLRLRELRIFRSSLACAG